MRALSRELGFTSYTTYQHYETNFSGDYLPEAVARRFVAWYSRLGRAPDPILALVDPDARLRILTEPETEPTETPAISLTFEEATDRLGSSVSMSPNATQPTHRHTMIGDPMAPTILPGEDLMVDHADRVPSPGGIFVINDGISEIVRQVEYVPFSRPSMVRISPRNSAYETTVQSYDAIKGKIVGRVIAKIVRL